MSDLTARAATLSTDKDNIFIRSTLPSYITYRQPLELFCLRGQAFEHYANVNNGTSMCTAGQMASVFAAVDADATASVTIEEFMEFCLVKNGDPVTCGKYVAFLFKDDAQTLTEAPFSKRLLLLDDRSLIPGCKKHAVIHPKGTPAAEGSGDPATPSPSPSEAGCVKAYHAHLATNMTVSPGLLSDCGAQLSWLNVASATGLIHIETPDYNDYFAVQEDLGVLQKDQGTLEALRDDFGVPESDMNGFFNFNIVGANVPKGMWPVCSCLQLSLSAFFN
jgi:hypothetical protein